jgi:hypothetical protein
MLVESLTLQGCRHLPILVVYLRSTLGLEMFYSMQLQGIVASKLAAMLTAS